MHRYRSHTCQELSEANTDQVVRLAGWLHSVRDHGGVLFVDLRDHHGRTQLVVHPSNQQAQTDLRRLSRETVLAVDGVVRRRPAEAFGTSPTGRIEVEVTSIEVLGPVLDPLPFEVNQAGVQSEELRLSHRFLDLRTGRMQRNIVVRTKIIDSLRLRMKMLGFLEVQTPILTSSSPEGARDYLVPSRRFPGRFYALPQAPQQFKQLLMVSGFDRYFQIAPCFRDEDGRSDRSPTEFYQLDLEMSFATQEDVFAVVETVLGGLFEEFRPDAECDDVPFKRLTFAEAMDRYGTDKPDLRIPLELTDLGELARFGATSFLNGKHPIGIRLPPNSLLTRRFFDTMSTNARALEGPPVSYLRLDEFGEATGPLASALTAEGLAVARRLAGLEPGDSLLVVVGEAEGSRRVAARLRVDAAEQLGLVEANAFRFCWIVDFPMYELDDDGHVTFSHNPFSMPQGGLEALETMTPLEIRAFQYDLVCNGYEISSGAVRNHSPEIMLMAFKIAGYGADEVAHRFPALAKAFRFGAPPHAGIAPGLDRIVMLILGEKLIRDVVAFPMTVNGQDLLMGAPSLVPSASLRELHISNSAESKT